MLRYLIFDLDETLYPPNTGLWAALGERIHLFIAERLGVSLDEARALRERYAREFGVTLTGLLREHAIDPDDYLHFVHDLPLADYIQPNAALNGMLARLPLPKVILTNASAEHARRVIAQLGVARHFNRIIDIRALNFINKPQPEAFARALELLNARPQECLFADDLIRNVHAARSMGFLTVLVREAGLDGGAEGRLPDGADYQIPDILGLERVVAGLIGQA